MPGPGLLFSYGTLQDPLVMEDIIGTVLEGRPARLPGYRMLMVKGEDYPAVVPAAGSIVEGTLFYGVTERHWISLDQYEGDEYQRLSVSVIVNRYVSKQAFVYQLKPQRRDLVC